MLKPQPASASSSRPAEDLLVSGVDLEVDIYAGLKGRPYESDCAHRMLFVWCLLYAA